MVTAWLLFGFTGLWCVFWLALIVFGVCGEKAEVYGPFAYGFWLVLTPIHLAVWVIHNWQ